METFLDAGMPTFYAKQSWEPGIGPQVIPGDFLGTIWQEIGNTASTQDVVYAHDNVVI